MERSDIMCSTGERNGKPLQYSCIENPMNNMKRQNDRILKEELPKSVVAQYATGDQWRNNSRKNEGMEPKQRQYPAVDVTGDRSKAQCCKEQYCIGTWNVRSMNQGKLEVVKQELARVNVNILLLLLLSHFTHVHRVRDAIQPSHPLSSPSPPAPNSPPASESFPMSQLFA